MATIHTFTGNEIIATEVPKYLNDNFSALNSVGEDIKTQLGAKAPLASPTLTGIPEAPTASEGTNTTQIATTAFVTNAVKVKSVNGETGDVVVGIVSEKANIASFKVETTITKTISGLTPYKPLYIGVRGTEFSGAADYFVSEGTSLNSVAASKGSENNEVGNNITIWRYVIPTATSVVVTFKPRNSSNTTSVKMIAYQ